MGRYRPPSPPKSPYITQQGYTRLKNEEKAIWIRRRETTTALTAAAAEGDRSENAEYIYRKKELREIDRRIRYLQKRLPTLKVVNQLPSNTQQIFFGAWVSLVDDQGQKKKYRIVGPDEIDHAQGYISMDSPIAKSLMTRSLGDEILAKVPSGEFYYEITAIEYE